MRPSKFNLIVENYPALGEHLLFNCRTQALIKINQELKDALEQPLVIKLKENLQALRESGIIVADEFEEQEKLQDFFRQLKYESDKLALEVTILTTYGCNFRCVYCFEESVKESVFLDPETSDFVIQWLVDYLEKKNFKRVYFVYYGGEPLLNTKPIYYISGWMQEYTKKRGIDFGFGIITNGSLIKPRLIDELLPLGLKNIRTSIDGDRQAHNKKRPFLDGSPSFDLIIDNIKSIIGKVGVGVVGNFDRENFESIPKLFDYLEQENLLKKLNRINFLPIAPRLGPKVNPGAIELSECIPFFSKDGLHDEIIYIKEELRKRGIVMPVGLAINACSLTMQDAAIAIEPQGAIYKCNALLGYPEFSVGNVRQMGFNSRYQEFLNIDAWNKCPKDCPYIPMCQGGCRFFSFLEHKNLSELSCKREYLDRIMPELIKLEYQKLKKA